MEFMSGLIGMALLACMTVVMLTLPLAATWGSLRLVMPWVQRHRGMSLGLAALALAGIAWLLWPVHFDQAEWQRKRRRLAMVPELERTLLRPGVDLESVVAVLGEPRRQYHGEEGHTLLYPVGSTWELMSSAIVLRVRFDPQRRLVSSDVLTED